jgi:hypothetical protein
MTLGIMLSKNQISINGYLIIGGDAVLNDFEYIEKGNANLK